MLQVKSHEKPLQVAMALGGGAQAWHELEPHEFTEVLATHAVPHLWKPALQMKSHCSLPQIATELGGGVQGVHRLPQVATSLFVLHSLPQR